MPPAKVRVDHKKSEADQMQGLVVELLREDENKYCADCQAKQPRWASWNLGIFLCIRCAGIHRNLGVHLSKIKSVNLDTWSAEQVQSMRVMGNKLAKQVYEADLPEHFRRPQIDQTLETFIRAKYEHKRYILKDWSPPIVDANDLQVLTCGKRRNSLRSSSRNTNSTNCDTTITSQIPAKETGGENSLVPPPANTNVGNLLDLDDVPVATFQATAPKNSIDDIFGVGGIESTTTSNDVQDVDDDEFGPIVSCSTSSLAEAQNLNAVLDNFKCATSVPNIQQAQPTTEIGHLCDIASLCEPEPALPQKKSMSDIMALFDFPTKGPTRPPLQSNLFTPRYPLLHRPPNTTNPSSFVDIAAIQQSFLNQQPVGSDNLFESDVRATINSQKAFAFLESNKSSGRTQPIATNSLFMSKETAAMFAAASPFAASKDETSQLDADPLSQVLHASVTLPKQNATDISTDFVADFSELDIGGSSSTQGTATASASILWD